MCVCVCKSKKTYRCIVYSSIIFFVILFSFSHTLSTLLSQFFFLSLKYKLMNSTWYFRNQNPILTWSKDLWGSTIIRLPSCFERFLAASTGQILKTPTHTTHTHTLSFTLVYNVFFSTLLLSFCIIAILLQILFLKLNQVTHPFFTNVYSYLCKMWKINDVKYSAIFHSFTILVLTTEKYAMKIHACMPTYL